MLLLQVDREKKRAAAAAAREKREAASKGWFGWLRGGTSAQTVSFDIRCLHTPLANCCDRDIPSCNQQKKSVKYTSCPV